ncbi:taurine ABC transporter permease [Helicobacter sp. 13S00401-1]|uniref:ABC transporter permease n=1 Tax=Helicobacter sp. 13S00401-1 TaxID=1905758 RepID=UPI000BA7903F|nr:ABC transporter permease [Helicobacter sp. 13S00401-1]PAF50716.1 taurine ABC transporter permease [Helicobacter sp. 13S00401-1]
MKIRLLSILVIIIFGGIWQAFSSDIIPSPWQVAIFLKDSILDGSLLNNIESSLIRYVIGFVVGSLIAIILAFIISSSKTLSKALDPLIQILRPISPIAWFPIIVIVFGIGDLPTIFIIAYAIFFPMLLLTLTSIYQIDKIYYDASKNFGASVVSRFINVTLPGSFIGISSALKMSASLAWINLVVGEMVGAQSGLGYMIIDQRNLLQTDGIIAAMVVIGLIGYCLHLIFEKVERVIKIRLGAVV